MKVKVKFFGQYRQITKSKEVELEAKGDTMGDVISSVIATYPELGPLLLSGNEIKPYAYVMLNGVRVVGQEGLAMQVKESDDITMFPPMAGG